MRANNALKQQSGNALKKESCARLRATPHPAFGHLLPQGEKEAFGYVSEFSAASACALERR